MRTENASLKAEMDELKLRIEKLEAAEGAACPLCGQPLSAEHRQSTLEQLQAEGKQKGDNWRANKSATEELATQLMDFEAQLSNYARADADRLRLSNTVAQLTERLETMKKQTREWEKTGAKRLAQVNKLLDGRKIRGRGAQKTSQSGQGTGSLGYEAADPRRGAPDRNPGTPRRECIPGA